MSIRIMSQVWGQIIEPHGKKLVLLAFADAANDDGLTWIAIESQRGSLDLKTKCCMSLRAIRGHVAQLELDGHLERNETLGKGCIWRVYATPAKSAGVQGDTPANSATTPANSAGEPLLNHQEKEKTERLLQAVDKCPLLGRPLPTGVTLAQWEAFLDMRAAIAKKVRPYVAQVVLAKLDAVAKAGWHPGDVLDRSTVNGWADVYEPETGRVTGVRRVAAGHVGEPVGMTDQDKGELVRIANIRDVGQMLQERREFIARVERRNAASSIGALIGELPLRPPLRGDKR